MTRKPAALLALDTTRNPDTFAPEQLVRIAELTELLRREPIADFNHPAIRSLLQRTEILITGWGVARISPDVLDAAPRLRLIAHAAGTVKFVLDPAVWQRGILVTNAAAANALPVAEFTLAAILFANKQVFRLQRIYRQGRAARKPWRDQAPGLGNYAKTIGIVGASRVGRRVIELLTPFDFRIQVFDPFLAAAEAHALGVDIVELDTLMATSDLVSLHAPSTPATQGMIDRRRLALLRDGAILVNTARGALVDQDALIDETRSGRIDAVIDVTEPDVLPPDSPLYDIPNVFLTPHIAGSQGSETQRMTDVILDEIARYVRGEKLRHQVAFDALERLA
jgi:phosphoglycerate dehydrogenase-like enzyme